MKGDTVPDTDHIARRCGGSRVKEDGTISGAAFRLRKLSSGQVEPYLSVNWLEILDEDNSAAQISKLRKILAAKFSVGSAAKIAVLNVGEMRDYVRRDHEARRVLHVLHEPVNDDRSHSGIHNLKLEDERIADLIAQTVKEVYKASGAD